MRILSLLVVASLTSWSAPASSEPSLAWQDLRFYAPAEITALNQPLGTRIFGVGVLTGIDFPFFGHPAPGPDLEYTLYFSDLDAFAKESIADSGGLVESTFYTNGSFEIFKDSTPDHDFGVGPPNATVPTTFTDGEVILQGRIDALILSTRVSSTSLDDGLGVSFHYSFSYECISDAFGMLSWDPQEAASGYFIRHVGGIQMDCTDQATVSSWGRVKAGYR